MSTKYLRIGFYQPHITSDPITKFGSILSRFEKEIPTDQARTWEARNDEPLRLQSASRSASFWTGDMMRIRMHEDLRKGRRDGSTEDITFQPDEGLGENTAFLYHPATNTLAVHEHRGGVSVGMFARYFQNFGEVAELDLRPLIKPEAIERAAGLKTIRAFEIQLAGVYDSSLYSRRNSAARSVFEMMGSFGAPKAKIVLETGIRKGAPDQPTLLNVISCARAWLSGRAAEHNLLEKIVISGYQDENDSREEMVINLLHDRLIELVPVILSDGARITDANRLAAVIKAWETHRDSISRVYGTQA